MIILFNSSFKFNFNININHNYKQNENSLFLRYIKAYENKMESHSIDILPT
jgi:hypothetical protein